MKEEKIRKMVRKRYASVATKEESCCQLGTSSTINPTKEISRVIGYTEEEISSVPQEANLGLGCGNPVALASLKKGQTVLDLGSGGGLDCFLSAKRVGTKGKVIGVDMTPDMIDRARENARKGKYDNVEFRLGEIENLPVADESVDVIISNCVINLSTNKKRVFEESYRVLSPKGRLMVSDIVLLKELPEAIQKDMEAYAGCIAGAEIKDKYLELIRRAGFKKVKILQEKAYPIDYIISEQETQKTINRLGLTKKQIADLANSVVSISVSASKQ